MGLLRTCASTTARSGSTHGGREWLGNSDELVKQQYDGKWEQSHHDWQGHQCGQTDQT